MEGSGSGSGSSGRRRTSSPELIDLEEEADREAPTAQVGTQEEEDDDDDIITLDDTLLIPRAESPEIEILTIKPRRRRSFECIDLVSESDSDVEVLETPSRALVGEQAAEDASLSPLSMADVKRDDEGPLGDVQSLAEAVNKVTIVDRENQESSSSHSGDMSSPQPSSSSPKDVMLDQNCAVNLVDDFTGEGSSIPPAERMGEDENKRIVYISKPDFSSLPYSDKSKLREQLLRQMSHLEQKCRFDQPYQRRYPPGTIRKEDGSKTILKEDGDGSVTKLVFKPAEYREADERKADPAFQLPPRAIPSFHEMLAKKMPEENEGAMLTSAEQEAPKEGEGQELLKNCLDESGNATPPPPYLEDKQEEYKGPVWDTQEDVDEFCRSFNEAFDAVSKESKEKKEKEEAARMLEKENRKKALAAMLAEFEKSGKKRTRLATGAITRKVITSKEVGQYSTKASPVRRQQQSLKRKDSKTDASSEIEFSNVPTLHRTPLCQPGPSGLSVSVQPPPPPPPPMMDNQEPGTSKSSEKSPSTSLPENEGSEDEN